MTTDFWMQIWTFIFFTGVCLFALLSVLVIFFGGFDIAALLRSLQTRHDDAEAAEAAEIVAAAASLADEAAESR
jgi:uncharacterized membrane protein